MRSLIRLVVVMSVVAGCGQAELKPEVTPDPRILLPDAQPEEVSCPSGRDSGEQVSGSIVVLVSEPFRDVMLELKQLFGGHSPQADLGLHIADTGELAERLAGGEEADVVAVDEVSAMRRIEEAGRVSDRARIFARSPDGAPYEIAALCDPVRNLPAAMRFIGVTLSDEGQRAVAKHGFKLPD